jgi:8-oxo-dGTP pyrophosphatase MutT (NUDIX family)
MGYILDLRKQLGSRPLIMAGAGVVVLNDKNEILLGRRTDNGCWDYPAGSMELGESFEECARREVQEETGLLCGKLEYLMNTSGKDTFYKYPNGDQVYLAALIFVCRDYSGEMKVQEEEVYEQRFFSLDDLPSNIDPLNIGVYDKVREYLEKDRR